MRFVHGIILVVSLLAALAVAGCICCGGSPGGTVPTTGTPTPGTQTSASLPVAPGDLQNLKYLWDHVHYLHQTSYTTSTIPDMDGVVATMTWRLGDGNYKGQPAKLLSIGMNSSADQTKVSNSISANMGFDIYFSRVGDVLTMLGGQAYIQLGSGPDSIMKGDLNVSKMVEQSRISGYTDPVTGESVAVIGEPKFSPTIDLSKPVKPLADPTSVATLAEGGYDMNKIMSAGSAEYEGFGNITLTPAGQEILKIGSRNINCYKYNWTVVQGDPEWEGQYTSDFTVWYSPEFPAQPLKTVRDMNNGQTVLTTVVDEWN